MFEHSLFISDWTKMAILQADVFDANPEVNVVVETGGIQPMAVILYHPAKQPTGNRRVIYEVMH